MKKSVWKFPYISNDFLKILQTKSNLFITQQRSSLLVKFLVGREFQVYNGFQYQTLKIKRNMLQQKFGEFVRTRKYPRHPVKKTIKKKK